MDTRPGLRRDGSVLHLAPVLVLAAAVLSMHGLGSPGRHTLVLPTVGASAAETSAVAPAGPAPAAARTGPLHHGRRRDPGRMPVGHAAAEVVCAFAVVAVRSTLERRRHRPGRIPAGVVHGRSRLVGGPEPPVPRLAV